MSINNGAVSIYQESITKSAVEPANPSLNDLWVDTLNKRLKLWDGTEWVNIGYEPETPTTPDDSTEPDDPTPTDPEDPGDGGESGGDGAGDDGGESGGSGDEPGEEENPGTEPEEGGS